MLTPDGLKVLIEFNLPFRDPECQTLDAPPGFLGGELAQVLLACASGKLAESAKP